MIFGGALEEQLFWELHGAIPYVNHFQPTGFKDPIAGFSEQASPTSDDRRYELRSLSPLKFSIKREELKCDAKQETDTNIPLEKVTPPTRSQIAKEKLRSRRQEIEEVEGKSKLKRLKPKFKIPRGRLHKQERNALTNIGCQLLTFLSTRMRCNYDI